MGFLLDAEVMGPSSATVGRSVVILHGIFGSRRNWQAFARRWSAREPDARFLLVDLRGHGGSREAPPPHTMSACAQDLDRLFSDRGWRPECVVGHSFGGKVALAWLQGTDRPPTSLFSLDSPPSPGPAGGGSKSKSEVARLLTLSRRFEGGVVRRSEVSRAFVEAGINAAVASWMATNLVADGEGRFHWHFDCDTLEALLLDYWATDLRSAAESPVSEAVVHLVRAEKSDRFSSEDIRWLESLKGEQTRVHVLPEAGHWLHVDQPDALLEILMSTR